MNTEKPYIGTYEQFIDQGRIITYLPEYGYLPYAYALFKIYRKKPVTLFERIKIFLGFKYVLTKGRLIASQVNERNLATTEKQMQ